MRVRRWWSRPPGTEPAGTIVFFHGFTNCPAQFSEAAKVIAARGWRVLVPRAPLHGEKDLLTRDLTKVTVGDLARHVDMSVDVAAGFRGRSTSRDSPGAACSPPGPAPLGPR